MALQTTPFVLQGASTGANIFRQSVNAAFLTGGILAVGELAVTAQSSPNMTVAVAPGRAKVVGSSATAPAGMSWTTQSMYDVLNDASTNVTISSADSTNPRIDLVYIQVQDAFYTGSANQAVLAVATGTPGVSPSAPSTPVNAIALATVAVAANATTITNANISNLTSKATLVGQVVVYQTLALRDAATGMKANDLCAVVADSTTTNNAFYYYTGSAWASVTSNTFDASAIVSGTLSSSRLPTVPTSKGGTGKTSWTANRYVITDGTGANLTEQNGVPTSSLTGTVTVAQGGTGLTSMTTGIIKYDGTNVVSGQKVDVTADLPTSEQVKIHAGGVYSGGLVAGGTVNIYVQSTQPASGMTTGDLWFWGV
jgi:hypothetical protein